MRPSSLVKDSISALVTRSWLVGGDSVIPGSRHIRKPTHYPSHWLERCQPSAVFAIEELADGAAASLIQFAVSLACVGIHGTVSATDGFGLAACGTTVGEAGLVRLQFKLFRANDTNFDGERHTSAPTMVWRLNDIARRTGKDVSHSKPLFSHISVEEFGHVLVRLARLGQLYTIPERMRQSFENNQVRVDPGVQKCAMQNCCAAQ
jgi:hypothetical protein